MTLDIDHLRKVLRYDPETGVFTRGETSNPNPKAREGMIAGTLQGDGYLAIRIGRKRYLSHRLAWFYVYGEWPIDQTDHINRIRTDNRISNLRQVNRSQNMHNMDAPRHNRSGIKGVSFDSKTGKWFSCITLNRRTVHLGRYANKEDAAIAYDLKARELFSELNLPSVAS
jgi:hypothetical protein